MLLRTIDLSTPDGTMPLYEARPEGAARGAVIVVQEAFGVNQHIEDVARRFAGAGYHAVAPHLFHRAPAYRNGTTTAPYGEFEKVIGLFAGLDDDAVLRDIDATIDFLHHQVGWPLASVGIVGFCFGGRVTFLVAARRGLGGAVGFYGGGIASAGRLPFPSLLGEAASLATPWLGLFGDLDDHIPVDEVEALREALVESPVDADVVRYAEAGHGFFCDARDSYHAPSAADAWQRTLAWFGAHLEPAASNVS